MDAIDVIFGQKNSTVTTPSYLTFIRKPMPPSYQELEELVKTKDDIIESQADIIRLQDEKIRDLKNALNGTWEAVDRKIDQVKSYR